ncbi:glycosyl transferase family 2 [Fibrisoma limi BUZ 3]|uniref:Glycosyl transferase family 2 n=1 Tax=Fibrisoma limi BUZ 3 TaxID=1185876 RepID=I2GSU4_9BACT|nr:glycosyltransferase family 2 protein [Fibrisoma limi]CCH56973.1 glycosyl transferase family 2 [Fibrisoma limi BUZ 3]
MDKSVSIALATYNGAAYLKEQLDSLLAQSYPIKEIIVCDDRSTDDTVKILYTYNDRLPLKIYVNSQSLGVTENFKKAVSLCTGDYIALCDQDDVWRSDKIEKSVVELRKIDVDSELPALIYTDLEVVDQNLATIAPSFWKLTDRNPSKVNFVKLLLSNVVTGCTVLMNRRMAEEMQKMPEGAEMHDFWLALIAYGIGKSSFIKQATVKYRQHGRNVTITKKVNLWTRLVELVEFIVNLGDDKSYKMDAIRQADVFFSLYGSQSRLPPLYRRALERIVTLKNKPPWIRKVHVLAIKYSRWKVTDVAS